jgi:hypothetical protein
MITEMGIKRQEKSLSPDVSAYKYRCYIAEMGQIFAPFLYPNQRPKTAIAKQIRPV